MRNVLGNHYILITILIVVVIISAITYSINSDDSISKVIQNISSPIQKVFGSIQGFFSNLSQNVADFRSLQKERDELFRQNSMLKVSETLLKEARIEIKHLEEILEYDKNLEEIETLYAKVASRNPNNWFDSIVIDVGEKDGVVVGMSVIALQDGKIGLVGVIDQIAENTSKVHLLIDPSKNIAAAAKIQGTILGDEEAVFDGIIEGSSENLGYLKMIYISHEARIDIGAEVYSTGLGGFYVPNIPIGNMGSLKYDAYGLLQIATIEPHVDFTRIKDVLVVMSPLPVNIGSDENE